MENSCGFLYVLKCSIDSWSRACYIIDLNECDSGKNGGCGQICNNMVGSYYCSCQTGYELDEDGRGCSGTLYASRAKYL